MAVNDEIPKSRLMLRYKTEVDGELKDKELPFRLLVVGDLSQGLSNDRKQDFDERKIRHMDGTIDSMMKDMNMELNISVANRITPTKSPNLDVKLKIDSMKSFQPGVIAESVPQLKSLIKLREMVQEFESTVDNNKGFRNLVKEILRDESTLEKIKQELPALESFKMVSEETTDKEVNVAKEEEK
ncbi:type VI secretion system contractile sheath small subunit [Allofrancisella guangzhouensis]|uniref:Intracellular growth locus, subunit A n=1 Tax=Allofrancisella guangzhouensis TaxID=594679 RepID=A0A0A8E319_9GAMM|nr:type VI secretion system contractile sheath small subunit [Allofrancisella guangzhouensis]AJC48369.1 intracellular growth locus, subunit A [Allofrancisella guangzhouensis]MBK2026685.1 type VI secretion system contractile sheath small subunit [Allofrancisella guangzhouensis]MBK2044172.1 type VI secretion system contractile sheath small subunit [Allofrancisella guangzhouensis]MBK2045522.1 type VI secretion system contractile sheath small subunit [Allofrancisella guangzhouensis]